MVVRVGSLQSIGALALLAASFPVDAKAGLSTADNACARYAPEAASRSGLSTDIMLRVMMAESGGNPRTVSVKGAMGCMQIMPATWSYLTSRYSLGTDPFDPRRNMIAGAMYLAELAARYGMAGAVAAYNAGPGRYERYAAGAATLPAETVAYTARIGAAATVPISGPITARWQEASLFLARDSHGGAADTTQRDERRGDALFPIPGSRRDGAGTTPGP